MKKSEPEFNWRGCAAVLFLLCVALVVSCTSAVVPPESASWDGNPNNSGFVSFSEDGGAFITVRARDRYNALIAEYGRKFTPDLHPNDGCEDSNEAKVIYMDAEHLAKFATMNRWRKEGVSP